MIFIFIWVLVYSVGFTNPESLHRSLPLLGDPSTGLGFWLAQNPKRLGSQPWFYYLTLMAVYEPLILIGYLHSAVAFIFDRKRSIFAGFLLWWALSSFVVFSLAGEKFPWLLLPSLLALATCSGYFLGQNFLKFRWPVKIAYLVLVVWTIFVAVQLNYLQPAETRELAVYVQTPPTFQKKINEILSDCQKSPKSQDCILIDQKVSWPISWSFREYSTLIYPENMSVPDGAKYIVIGSEDSDRAKIPDGWSSSKVGIRDWWVPTACHKIDCFSKFARYFLFRQTWNEKGGYDVYIYHR